MYYELDDHTEDEKRVSSLRLLGRLLPFVRPHLRTFSVSALLLLLAVGGELAGPLLLRKVIDEAIPRGSVGQIALLAGIFAGLFALTMLLSYLQVVLATKIGLSVVRDVKGKVFAHMLTLSRDFYDSHPTGRLMARVESDGEKVRMLFSDVSMALLHSFTLVLGTLVVMAITDLRITMGVVLLMVPVAVITVPVLRHMRVLYGRLRGAYARVAGVVSEYVRSIPVLQVFRATNTAAEKLHQTGKDFVRKEVRAMGWEYVFWSFLGSCEVAAVVVILLSGRGGVATGALTAGTVVLFIEYTRRLFQPIVMFSSTLNQVQRALASAERLFGILDTKTMTPEGSGGEDEFPEDWGQMRFERIWFRYGRGDWVLRDVSFAVPRGSMVALVGSSGGGKSTLVSLLMRFYEPQRGRITMGGKDLRDFKLRTWRRRMGLVLQEVSLFSGTLSENLTLFDDSIPRERQLKALESIEASNLLSNLPRGLDTEISEGGQNLSMGERQLVCFARAVLRRPEILVLDEATSAVDPGTEKKVQRAMDLMTEGRTMLVVAHRLSTVRHADRIVVLQDGAVVEEGDHRQLLELDGTYAGLCRLQLGGGSACASTLPG
ncbi:ATP-binding cassette domain-containing protein [Candidatus Fermentibacteria bacterium]|nr:ATP-binding cassette domain-containing protein [Candidatus Fermentibacteria bacterium]